MAEGEPPRQHGATRLSCPTPATNTGGSSNFCSFLNRVVSTWLLCAMLSLVLFNLLWFYPIGASLNAASTLLQYFSLTSNQGATCDYSQGRWVPAPGRARLYNGTECNIKESERCTANGRPDTGYLDWRWQPTSASCELPPFDAAAFIAAARGKHVAFVGDSMARNQGESLVCLLSSAFRSEIVYRNPNPRDRRFWRWAFPSHNVTLSVYWAPFLAKSGGKTDNYREPHNLVYLDELAERWAADVDTMDVVVLTQGHWFWMPIVYHGAAGEIIGMHNVTGLNATVTDLGLFSPYRRTLRLALDRLVGSASANRTRTVVVATFSPSHFEKAWDDPTTCARTRPYEEGEKEVGEIEGQLGTIVKEEVASAAAAARSRGGESRVEVLDVTKLATMRPDGHPGVYMNPDPFKGGAPKKKLQIDCLHFCLPGPVDTFNEILQQLLISKRRGRTVGGRGSCDYSQGRWVAVGGTRGRYNGMECDVKGSENCVHNGRPDTGYQDWRWQPASASCRLPAFDAAAFLAAALGRHVTFVGDSMARNQAESLVCLLSSAFPYRLVYRDPEPGTRKFWRCAFPDPQRDGAPLLAVASGRSENFSVPYNVVHLDTLAERWSADAGTMDVAVISTGHWFWNPTVYYRNGGEVVTEIGFFSPYRDAIRMLIDRLLISGGRRGLAAMALSTGAGARTPAASATIAS
uniref:Trichome birefringence-like N-terminal domain-containing protein n=1 Tax=Leersia perrieri TaxID=77586 RepID=A0A0D9WNP4_9ORYZ